MTKKNNKNLCNSHLILGKTSPKGTGTKSTKNTSNISVYKTFPISKTLSIIIISLLLSPYCHSDNSHTSTETSSPKITNYSKEKTSEYSSKTILSMTDMETLSVWLIISQSKTTNNNKISKVTHHTKSSI